MKHFQIAFGDLPPSPMSQLPSNPSDTDLGTFALSTFWQKAQAINSQIPGDWQGFLELLRRAYYPKDASEAPAGYPKSIFYPNASSSALGIFIDGLGLSLRSVGFDQSPDKIATAMESLASQGGGSIPSNQNSFFGIIQNAASQINFFDAAAFVARESASQVADAAVQVGDAALNVGQGALTALNTFAQYETYAIAGALALAGYYAYWRFIGSKRPRTQRNPKRKRKSKKNPCMTGIDGSEVCF